VTNLFNEAFPEAAADHALEAELKAPEGPWPVVPGEYHVMDSSPHSPVAVSTLASADLADEIAARRPRGLSIVGKTETENLGVEKVVLNVITNPWIRHLVLAGADPLGHHSGRTLVALGEQGVDPDMRVIGSPGRRPVLKNVAPEEAEAFRRQVQVIDLMGCEAADVICEKVEELSAAAPGPGPFSGPEHAWHAGRPTPVHISTVPVIKAGEAKEPKLDKKGYFVVLPQAEKKNILVEQYSNDNQLLRVIEGEDVRDIYLTIIENGLISRLDHAAYLGKELEKAELSLKLGFRYVQDGA